MVKSLLLPSFPRPELERDEATPLPRESDGDGRTTRRERDVCPSRRHGERPTERKTDARKIREAGWKMASAEGAREKDGETHVMHGILIEKTFFLERIQRFFYIIFIIIPARPWSVHLGALKAVQRQ